MRKYGTLADLERWRLHFDGTTNEFKVVQYENHLGEEMVRLDWTGRPETIPTPLDWKRRPETIPASLENAWFLIVNYLTPLHCGITQEGLGDWSAQEVLKKNFGKVPLVVRLVDDRMFLTLSDPSALSDQDRESCSTLTSSILWTHGIVSTDWNPVYDGFEGILMEDLSFKIPLKGDISDVIRVVFMYFYDVTVLTT